MRTVRSFVFVALFAALLSGILIRHFQNRTSIDAVPADAGYAMLDNSTAAGQPQPASKKSPGEAPIHPKEDTTSSASSTGSRFEILYRKSLFDADAADELMMLASFCGLMRGPHTIESRFDTSSTWQRWYQECNNPDANTMHILERPRPPKSADMKLVEELSLSALSGDDSRHPDSELSRIISASKDYRAVEHASQAYFSQSRLRAWSKEFGTRNFSPLGEAASKFSLELSIILACRSSMNCRGDSIHAVRECSVTPACIPGAPMEDIVRSRVSPIEWTLLQQFADRARRR